MLGLRGVALQLIMAHPFWPTELRFRIRTEATWRLSHAMAVILMLFRILRRVVSSDLQS